MSAVVQSLLLANVAVGTRTSNFAANGTAAIETMASAGVVTPTLILHNYNYPNYLKYPIVITHMTSTTSNTPCGMVGPAVPMISKTLGNVVGLERGVPGSDTVPNAAPQALERAAANTVALRYPLPPPTVAP